MINCTLQCKGNKNNRQRITTVTRNGGMSAAPRVGRSRGWKMGPHWRTMMTRHENAAYYVRKADRTRTWITRPTPDTNACDPPRRRIVHLLKRQTELFWRRKEPGNGKPRLLLLAMSLFCFGGSSTLALPFVTHGPETQLGRLHTLPLKSVIFRLS